MRDREAVIRVLANSINEIPRDALRPAMFIPARSLLRVPASPERFYMEGRSSPSLHPGDTGVPEQQENLAGRVEALYALHQAGACLGVSVQITQNEEGLHIGRRSSAADSLTALTAATTLDEGLAALADIRKPIGDKGRGPISEMQRHAAALQLLARTIVSSENAVIPDLSWKLLETMFLDHVVGLGHDLERIASTEGTMSSHAKEFQPRVDHSASLEVRLRRFGTELEALDPQRPSSKVPDLQAELDAVQAEYRAVFSRRNGRRSVARSF